MTPELWKKVVDVLEALEPLDGPRRATELARLRDSDPEVAREVESLLRQQDSQGLCDLDTVMDNALRQLDLTDISGGGTGAGKMPERIGPYRVIGTVGQGGMGVVYRARDQLFHRSLAVKVLAPLPLDDAESQRHYQELKRRFQEEAQLMGQLQHPGIPPVHDRGALPEDGRPYFVMKLIKGKTLAALLQERQRPDQDHPRLLAIFEQICQTLAYAHSQRIVHRDLKPANVMIGAFREVQVMDWGLAKKLGAGADDEIFHEPAAQADDPLLALRAPGDRNETAPGQAMGTPAYMAPEQARGETKELDERCDVFGLGAILCEILTGQPPFTGRSVREILKQSQDGRTEPALTRLAQCGAADDLVQLTRRCLAVYKQDRPADAGVVLQAIASHLLAVQERLRQAELARAQAEVRTAEERKRRRLSYALTLTAVAAFIGLSVLAAGLFFKNEELREAQLETDKKRSEAETAGQKELEQRQKAEFERDRAEEMRYATVRANIVLAAAENDLPAMRSVLLDSLPVPGRPDLRGLEWRLGLSHLDREVGSGRVHFQVLSQTISADGGTIAFAGKDVIEIVDTAGKKKPITLDRRQEVTLQDNDKLGLGTIQLALSFDGSLLAVAIRERPVTIWKEGQLHQKFAPFQYGTIAFTPDATKLAIAMDKGTTLAQPSGGRFGLLNILMPTDVRFWDISTAQAYGPTLSLPGQVNAIAFCPTRPLVAIPTQDKDGSLLLIFDTEKGTELHRLKKYLSNVFFTPDGTSLVGSDTYGWSRWRFQEAKAEEELCRPAPYSSQLAISPDQRLLAVSAHRTIRFMPYPYFGQPILLDTFAGHRETVVKLVAIGNRLVSVDAGGVFRVWQTDSLRSGLRFLEPGAASSFRAELSLDGHTMVTATRSFTLGAEQVLVRRSSGQKAELERPLGVPTLFGRDVLAVSANGDTVAVNTPTLTSPSLRSKEVTPTPPRLLFWQGLSARLNLPMTSAMKPFPALDLKLPKLTGTLLEESITTPNALALSPDGKYLAIVRFDGTVVLWDLTGPLDRKPSVLFPPWPTAEFGYSCLTFSQDSRTLYHGRHGDLVAWDMSDPRPRVRKNVGAISVLAAASNGMVVAGTPTGRMLFWNGRPDAPILNLPGHTDSVTRLAFSPDQRIVVSASANRDGSIKLWDAHDGKELLTMQRGGEAAAIGFQPEGPSLVAVQSDGVVRTWRALSEKQVFEIVAREAALDPEDPRLRLARIKACWGYAMDRQKAGDRDEARRLLELGLQLLRDIPEASPIMARAERLAWMAAFEHALQAPG